MRRAWSPETLAKLFLASGERILIGLFLPKILAAAPVRVPAPNAALVETRVPTDVAPRNTAEAGTAEPSVA